MIQRKGFHRGGFLVLSLLMLAGCSTTHRQHVQAAGEFKLVFVGQSEPIPFVAIRKGFNMIYDDNLEAQDRITGSGMDSEIAAADYDQFQSVPGNYWDITNPRARVVLKYDTRHLQSPVTVKIFSNGVETGTVILRKSSIFDYQLIQY